MTNSARPYNSKRTARLVAGLLAILATFSFTSSAASLAAPSQSSLTGQIAYEDEGDIWLLDLTSGSTTQLTYDGTNGEPAWSPDGLWLAFTTVRNSPYLDDPDELQDSDIYMMRSDGSGLSRVTSTPQAYSPAFSPTSDLYFLRRLDTGSAGVFYNVVQRAPSGQERIVYNHPAGLCVPLYLSISPSGVPALSMGCGRGKYVYALDIRSQELTDLTEDVDPPLEGCGIEGVWAHHKPLLAVTMEANCGPFDVPFGLYTIDFSSDTPHSKHIPVGTGICCMDWSPDDKLIVYNNPEGISIYGMPGGLKQVLTEGSDPAWRPVAGTSHTAAPGMPRTGASDGQVWLWSSILAALAALVTGLVLISPGTSSRSGPPVTTCGNSTFGGYDLRARF